MNGLRIPLAAALVALTVLTAGCARERYVPSRATRPYPYELHRTETADIHVFREGTNLEIFNSTANSFEDFDLWVNQRFVRRIDSLPAGGNVRVELWGFVDEYGELFNAGGFFRTRPPTPVRLVEIQEGEDTPLLGLITIRAPESE